MSYRKTKGGANGPPTPHDLAFKQFLTQPDTAKAGLYQHHSQAAVMNLTVTFSHYNEHHPHIALGYHSSREYIRHNSKREKTSGYRRSNPQTFTAPFHLTMQETGQYSNSMSDLAELFSVSRPTAYRTLS